MQGFLAAYTLFIFDYVEESTAEEDANFVFYQKSYLKEIQGTGEESDFTPEQLLEMLKIAHEGCSELFRLQNQVLLQASFIIVVFF